MEKGSSERFMRLALDLARRGQGNTSPNPAVGAVIVKGTRIVGQGYHRKAGTPHAEVVALKRAGKNAQGGTLIVNLEPCRHYGRTPPCCDAIIQAGIRHVIIGMRDPNPITSGRGIANLRRAGVKVSLSVLADQAKRLNEPFEKAMRSKRPLVIAKAGQSLDGKIATASGESRWITSKAAREIGHRLRRNADAILVGINTVLRDDPLLTSRPGAATNQKNPIKVIVDSNLRIPIGARCLSRRSPAPTIIATTLKASLAKRLKLERQGAEVISFSALKNRVPLDRLCKELARRGIQSVLIEGGGEVMAGALRAQIIDRIAWFIAPILIGGQKSLSSIGGIGVRSLAKAVRLRDVRVRRIGPDVYIEGTLVYPKNK